MDIPDDLRRLFLKAFGPVSLNTLRSPSRPRVRIADGVARVAASALGKISAIA